MTLKYDPKKQEWVEAGKIVDLSPDANKNFRRSNSESLTYEMKRKQAEAEKEERIEQHINSVAYYRFAKKLASHIINTHPDFKQTAKKTIIFRNKQVDCFDPNNNQVIYSYVNLERVYKNNFCEYVTVAYLWDEVTTLRKKSVVTGYKFSKRGYVKEITNSWVETGLTGLNAVWAVALHELAHKLDWDRNQKTSHDYTFQECLAELITLFPYSEVEYLAED